MFVGSYAMNEPISKPVQGFTLMEMLVSLGLIALLLFVASPTFEFVAVRSREAELRSALRQIRSAIDQHKSAMDRGEFYKVVSDTGYPENLRVLIEGKISLRDPKNGRIYFLRRLPRDPFAALDVTAEESWGLRNSSSTAEQPQSGGDVFDVYSKSKLVGTNGIPYRNW